MEGSCIGFRQVETDELVNLAIKMLKDPKADLEFRVREKEAPVIYRPLMLDDEASLLEHGELITYFGSGLCPISPYEDGRQCMGLEEISTWRKLDGFKMNRNTVDDEIGASLIRTRGSASDHNLTALYVMSRFEGTVVPPALLHRAEAKYQKESVLRPVFDELRESMRQRYIQEFKRQLKDVRRNLEAHYR